MTDELRFRVEEAGFDVAQLPPEARQRGTKAFRDAVTAFFRSAYRGRGGRVEVAFEDGQIAVHWSGDAEQQDALQRALDLIEQNRRPEARTLLESLLLLEPEHDEALYNLGLLCSDAGELERAGDLLQRAVAITPNDPNAWVALGVARLRGYQNEQARPALEKAVELGPGNPFALRAYGALLLLQEQAQDAVEVLRRALAAGPADPTTALTLAQALLEDDIATHAAEAEGLLQQVLLVSPRGELAEQAQRASRRIADHNLRRSQGEGLRPAVVEGLLAALRTYETLSADQRQAVFVEVSALGEKGLPVNRSDLHYSLVTLPGSFSALELACLIEVGARQVLAMQDGGFGFEEEYEQAMRSGRSGQP